MATISYENVIPSPIENATTKKLLADGVHRTYNIKANDGYILHDKTLDCDIDIANGGIPLDEPILGFTRGTVSCAASYDFTANPREFYAVPEDSVPADQIFGGGDNNTEVM